MLEDAFVEDLDLIDQRLDLQLVGRAGIGQRHQAGDQAGAFFPAGFGAAVVCLL